MNPWQLRPVPLKFQFGDWTLFSVTLRLQVSSIELKDEMPAQAEPEAPDGVDGAGAQGFLIRGLPVAESLPALSRQGRFLRYAPLQYDHCYIDLRTTFQAYRDKFSSKTRSTIQRKIRKYAEHCGGEVPWRSYKTRQEVPEFLSLARKVSALSYQERLLGVGIPDTEEFASQACALADEDRLRAYVLFHGERPVAYLYCPVHEGVVVYAYLGYDPAFMQWSVGTILQWLALEQLFDEARFTYFDFTEGQSDHKRLFSTHQRRCANVYFIRSSMWTRALVAAHRGLDRSAGLAGQLLERWGLKARVKRLIRFAR